MATAVLFVPADEPDLWACYDPAARSNDTNAVFDALSVATGRGHALRPGVRSVSVRTQGVRVEISPYMDEAELADIRRDLAASPGVVSVREGRSCS